MSNETLIPVSRKHMWLIKQERAMSQLLNWMHAEQVNFNSNEFNYVVYLKTATDEVRQARNFLRDEIQKEITTWDGKAVKVVDATLPRPYVPSILDSEYTTPASTNPFNVKGHIPASVGVNLTGIHFGAFVVLGLSATTKARWVVECSCGVQELRKASYITNNNPPCNHNG